MSIWKRMFGRGTERGAGNATSLYWMQLAPMSAIALLDADAFSRAPAILHGLVGLREILTEIARAAFPEASQDTIVELTSRKCQLLAAADTNAGVAVNRLGSATISFCNDQGFDLVDCDSEGRGISGLYSAAFAEAWAVWHILVDANLSKDHWHRVFVSIPKMIDAPTRMSLSTSEDGQYVAAVMHRQMVKAHDLVDTDAGPSFDDFCCGAVERMRRGRVPFDTVPLREVLGQRHRR